MTTPQTAAGSLLGRETPYPERYDPTLLFPIPRADGRAGIGIEGAALPFIGHDRWHAYELGWLDARVKPCVSTATFKVPADSPNLIESKSFKLYLNSFNGERLVDEAALRARIQSDLSQAAGAPVTMDFGLPPMGDEGEGECIDGLDIDIDQYGPPDASMLRIDGQDDADEVLVSHLLKSNCPVTRQPDWATLAIAYRGPRIDREALLRYVVGFRDHCEFHEQCVERVFVDLLARCRPEQLSVEARYTRRGGLDINPWRASPGTPPPPPVREPRQ